MDLPDFVTVGSPIKLSRTPVEYLRPAPMLGDRATGRVLSVTHLIQAI
jgi:crotonobetainyl-CoA:carnitine CoA-transferase CaiB-like acyl-CoA transferase